MEFSKLAGEVLREARVRRGMTLRDVARASGGILKPSSVAGYERGERAMSLDRFVQLTGMLGVPADRVVTEVMARLTDEATPDLVIDLTQNDGLDGLLSALETQRLLQTT